MSNTLPESHVSQTYKHFCKCYRCKKRDICTRDSYGDGLHFYCAACRAILIAAIASAERQVGG